MVSGNLLFYIIVAIPSLIWLYVFCRHIFRLARFFQLEGYDTKRYLRWFLKQEREYLYVILNLAGAIIVYSAVLYGVLEKVGQGYEGEFGLATFWGYVLAAFIVSIIQVIVVVLPRKTVKQPFAATQRAMRLLIMATVVGLIASFLIWVLTILLLRQNVPDYDSKLPIYMGGVVGQWLEYALPWAIVIAPVALPLANAINWPLEESIRRYYLRRAKRFLKRSGATVIAITGSYGKTSTKHYLHHILDGHFRVLMTPKSYNTLLGISRVINDVLAKDVSYEYFIVETDAYFVGENARICRLVEPQMGIVMTVGPMHLERLGSMENIAKAQYEVIQSLPPNGIGFFNGDDPAVRDMAGRGYPQTTVMITKQSVPGARLEALNIRMTAEGLDFDVRDNQTGEQRAMHAPLYGDHNVTNILMAAAVARALGMSLGEIGMRVTTLEPAEHRLIRRVMNDGIVLIDDTYSANPVGTQTALGVLALHKDSPHRVVVSSGMFELGPVSDQENRKLGERMAAAATDVILIGAAQTRPVKEGLESAAFPANRLHVVNSLNEAVDVYKQILRPGDALLMLTDLPDLYA